MPALTGLHIHITGTVQGVGFRPFVYGLAQRFGLTGWVQNTSAGVNIEVNGRSSQLDPFMDALTLELPPLAHIDTWTATPIPSSGATSFEIIHSAPIPGAFQPISPDISVCDDCRRELFDPADRRYLYPFINCTNCGPRFTIIKDIPYDRPQTTMASFAMCPDCATEYQNPLDRRFHAQPIACPACGPKIWLEENEHFNADAGQLNSGEQTTGLALSRAQKYLAQGKIIAIKGVGGFHLACDATNETAVSELRQRKLRRDKPFAVMMANLAMVEHYCQLNEAERTLLLARERPIVVLQRKPATSLAKQLAPGQHTIGVMLPYTPLHELLFARLPIHDDQSGHGNIQILPLVMTSGNLSEEPIAFTNESAHQQLGNIADAFLLHNRDIHVRCDDSVIQVVDLVSRMKESLPSDLQKVIVNRQFLRRSRGYAPQPIKLHRNMPPILATGPELKNTFCLSRDRYAFLSHHIGDMENYETLQSFAHGIDHFQRLFRIQPEAIAYDKHPNYLATRYALDRATHLVALIPVQHHHAHIAACLADNQHPGDRPVIGVSFDGTGYGDDGAIWGGEFLIADYHGYERTAHLAYVPMPGGDKAITEPWRMTLAHLQQANLQWEDESLAMHQASNPHRLSIVSHQIEKGVNAPSTSSMGRLFDAVAALIGIRQTVNYEAQAAIEMEMVADPSETAVYPFPLVDGKLDPGPLLAAILADLKQNIPTSQIAARFHNSVAQMVLDVCHHLRKQTGINEVALSGGVWQNRFLLGKAFAMLHQSGYTVYTHHHLPTNDGNIALGQVMVAAYQLGVIK